MLTKLLIDSIVAQTTVLIAELSTAAGVRAPLAHVADQVFLDLARALEAQGLGRKVVADMFGMVLRGYQKKVQRLEESVTVRDETLWEALLGHLRKHGGLHRQTILQRFERDGEDAVGAVLRDLVASGLVFVAGQGANALYRATSDQELQQLLDADSAESVKAMSWALAFHHRGISVSEVAARLNVQPVLVEAAFAALLAEGRVVQDLDPNRYSAKTLLVPVGSTSGWEAAVFDHFKAMAGAIASKLRGGTPQSKHADVVGGATLHFEISAGHPHEEEVLNLLSAHRAAVNALWTRVCAHNAEHPIPESDIVTVCHYFGQNVIGAESEEGK
ncbi:MAG: hypothetical protein SFV15_00350 [Polyangiaceae bacterium]|nr:hypothetical protein [Polyangiaceae bacterium]